MINKYVAMGLGALIALAPVVAFPVAGGPGRHRPPRWPAGDGTYRSHRGHMRRKGNTSAHRARASAHHMHTMRTAPAMAPKS